MESGDGGFVGGVWVGKASVLANEVFHSQDTAHPAGVITEEDAAKGSKGADEIGLDGDGRFDTVRIGRASDHGDASSRHDCDVEDVVLAEGRRLRVLQGGKERKGALHRGGEEHWGSIGLIDL